VNKLRARRGRCGASPRSTCCCSRCGQICVLPWRNHNPMHQRAARRRRPAVRLGTHLRPKGYSRAQVTLRRIALLHCSGEMVPCRPTDRSATPRRGTESCTPGRGARARPRVCGPRAHQPLGSSACSGLSQGAG
jgi:hypothetical protein